MIADEKDRLDILRIAVTLMIPKSSGTPAQEIAPKVLALARELEKYVKGAENGG